MLLGVKSFLGLLGFTICTRESCPSLCLVPHASRSEDMMYNARLGALISFTARSSKFKIGGIVFVFGNGTKPFICLREINIKHTRTRTVKGHTQPHTYALVPCLHTTNL